MSGGLDANLSMTRGAFDLDVALRIPRGRTVALLGPNGAGKSTVVAGLAGLEPLRAGHIKLDGTVLDDPATRTFVAPAQRRLGIVFQDGLLFPHLSVLENIAFGPRSSGMERRRAISAARHWLDKLDLAELAARRPADLSGGQAQRVALARALVTGPAMLLLDEPLSALDVTARARLRHTLADHLEEFAGPRLLITHDPTEAFLLADEVFVVEAGRITQVGSPDDIRLRPRTKYIADLAGLNLLVGVADRGIVRVGQHCITVADTTIAGDVLATINPRAIALHRSRPEGSPRNAWQTTLRRIEHYGDRVRVQTGEPVRLTAEVTPGAVAALELVEGANLWVSIKATEISLQAG